VSRPERPLPPPLEGNDRVITGVITSGFVVALIVLLILRGQLPHADRWWLWVAAFGTFLGLFGFIWVPILKRQRDRAAARRQTLPGSREETGKDATGQDGGGQQDADCGSAEAERADTAQADTAQADTAQADTAQADTGRAGQPGGARRP
jgi:Protein of unknown function (DUF2530)